MTEEDPIDPGYFDSLLNDPPAPDDTLIDWELFWQADHKTEEWLAEPILAAKRGTAIFAPGGTGKSLLALYIAAHIATGRDPFLRRACEPVHTLYLDYEMTESDLQDRLEHMGFGPDSDLTHLHYALLPDLGPLDSAEGGNNVIRLARNVDAELVVIDTFGRAVHGEENDADTTRTYYRRCGLHLKAEGRAVLRVDHAGKGKDQTSARGSSAKSDDVDVVWKMEPKDNGVFRMKAVKRRMGWIPLHVDIEFDDDDLLEFKTVQAARVWAPGTNEVAQLLDELGVSVKASTREASEAIKARYGKARRRQVVLSAQRYRSERSLSLHFTGDTTVRKPVDKPVDNPVDKSGNHPGNHPPPVPNGNRSGTDAEKQASTSMGTDSGTGGNPSPGHDGNRGGFHIRNPPVPGPSNPTPDDDNWEPF